MKTKILVVVCVLLLVSVAVNAVTIKEDFEVPLTESAFSRCQNSIREPSESCDLGTKETPTKDDLCPALGKILKIVQVCRSEDCACFPDRMDCGNEIRESAEWCDPGTKEDKEENDLCPKLSELLERPMVCNPDTCLCKATTDITQNVTCGDGKIEFKEECEQESDCADGKECKDCKCLIKIPEMNQTELTELLNQSDVPTPEEVKEQKQEEKKERESDYHNLVGTEVPEFFYSDFRKAYTNINVEKGDESYIVGVRTKHNVVQEIIDGGYEEPDRIVNIKESDAKMILDSEDRLTALEEALNEKRIDYRTTGLFSRMWFWFKGLFR